jgi:hypothetical protein
MGQVGGSEINKSSVHEYRYRRLSRMPSAPDRDRARKDEPTKEVFNRRRMRTNKTIYNTADEGFQIGINRDNFESNQVWSKLLNIWQAEIAANKIKEEIEIQESDLQLLFVAALVHGNGWHSVLEEVSEDKLVFDPEAKPEDQPQDIRNIHWLLTEIYKYTYDDFFPNEDLPVSLILFAQALGIEEAEITKE